MGLLLLVRHGQASLGTDDYDRLSGLGQRQSRAAGARLARAGARIDRAWCGSLMRQRDTALAIMAEAGLPAGELHTDARLDEYDHVGVFAGHGEEDRFAAATERTAESHRALQSALDEAIRRWIRADGSYAEPHATFAGRVGEVVRELAALPGTTVAVTSGGVIAVACAQLIGLSMEQWPALARVTVNGGVTKFITGPAGTHLLTFNDHAHLEGDRSLITYR